MAPRALVTLTAAIVFAALAIGDVLAVGCAVAGCVVIPLSAFLAPRGGASEEARRLPLATVAEHAGDPLEAGIAGMPDPVIALDRNGRVLTLNERARALAPALRQGEPVSLALRTPELIDAIGRAYASGEEQRVEYSERVPIDRWFEAIVVPVQRQADPGGAALAALVLLDL